MTAIDETVFFCSQEDDLRSFIRPRIEAAGADLSRVRFPDESTAHLQLPRDIYSLANYVQHNAVRLVVLDPLEALVAGMTSPMRIRDAMTPLTRMSMTFDCAVVIIHHFRKSGGKDVFAAIGGSGAITNAARAVYVYGSRAVDSFEALLGLSGHGREEGGDYEFEEGEEERVLASAKLSAGPPPASLAFKLHTVTLPGLEQPVPRVTLLGETAVSAGSILASGTASSLDPTQMTMVEEATQWLLGFLIDGERKTTDVVGAAKAEGLSARSIERARAEMKRKGLIVAVRHDDAWWLRLNMPDAPPES